MRIFTLFFIGLMMILSSPAVQSQVSNGYPDMIFAEEETEAEEEEEPDCE